MVIANRAPLEAMRDITFARSGLVPFAFSTSPQSPKTAKENDCEDPAGI